ncbi:hypothetical protein NSA18_12395 [Pasteurella caecimuris]|uniref:hypothetical protein n=1 Tax=Rodentibacter caecimuris TaxID=1796644 RepID=UPI0021502728|nr:hypothetical protein [Pasteurella caecimuris]MCR1838675.1 hypothetical protein [Pasteurella caecimuris]MCU0108136.1 hypothetical protein [Pasteurella caecimuris]
MRNLRIKSLSVLSHKTQSGNHFVFADHINIIQSKSNASGKSTLINLIYWTLGCNIHLDSWVKTIFCRVDFMIDLAPYSAFRTPNNLFYLQKGEELDKFEDIGRYQAALSTLFGINIQLKDHGGNTRNARPAHYFATSYISQEKGWNDFFAPPFDGLGEFKNYKTALAEQFTYRVPEQLFELERELEKLHLAIQEKNTQKNSIITLTKTLSTEDPLDSKVQSLTESYQTKLNDLNHQLDNIILKRIFLHEQIKFIQEETSELDKDYKFAVGISGPIICPQCGTEHKNGTIETVDLAAHSAALSHHEEIYKEEYKTLTAIENSLTNEIKNLKIHHKEELERAIDLENSTLFNDITLKMIVQLEQRLSNELGLLELTQKTVKKNLRKKKTEVKKGREAADKYFITRLKHYADKLGLILKYESIKSPADYTKMRRDIIEAGAADKNRSVLAYYLALYETAMQNSTNDMLPPLVIDTPMQNDQDTTNYQSMLNLLATQKNKQLFVCLINSGSLLSQYPNLHYITLNKVLDNNKFSDTATYFEPIQ